MEVVNDKSCGWIKDLSPRLNLKKINTNQRCDWLIVGAGFTGLSAARKLGLIYPDKKIILVDAQVAGEGASSRNSGYLVDTTLNDGFTSNKEVFDYKKKSQIYNLGIKTIKDFIKQYQVDCDWNECGKYFASSDLEDKKILEKFSTTLTKLNFQHKILYQNKLLKNLGTSFYKIGLKTKGGILLHPAKLIRAMIDVLPPNVSLFENSQLFEWKKKGNLIECNFLKKKIISDNIIFCTNGFLRSLGIKKNYSFPITLTASMTKPLSNEQFKLIGKPNEWGVLPVKPMGATIRMTKNRRILIRNTAELHKPNFMSHRNLQKRKNLHLIGIKKRFPILPNNIIDTSWSGVVCRSGNSSQIFEKVDKNIFVAGCYNGSGIGVGTLFGEQIAVMASNQDSDEILTITNRKKPNWLPPQPFLNIGIYSKLFYERIRAYSEI